MGNYTNIEHDFVVRTLALISQYESDLHQYPFEEQYNYTLLINCMLGLVIMPKERVLNYIPNNRLTNKLKKEMGLSETILNPNLIDLRSFIKELRNSIAHFSIEIKSENGNELIDRIYFNQHEDFGGELIADFKATELLPFVRYYGTWLQKILIEHF